MVGLRKLRITNTLVRNIFGNGEHVLGTLVVSDGLPEDVRVVYGEYEEETASFVLTCASAEWELPEGSHIPFVDPLFTLKGGE